jgi:tousled-like kinase
LLPPTDARKEKRLKKLKPLGLYYKNTHDLLCARPLSFAIFKFKKLLVSDHWTSFIHSPAVLVLVLVLARSLARSLWKSEDGAAPPARLASSRPAAMELELGGGGGGREHQDRDSRGGGGQTSAGSFLPAMVGRDEASLRKLSLLEARMMGLNQGSRGGESDGGSRPGAAAGGDSNSSIGFRRPKQNISPPRAAAPTATSSPEKPDKEPAPFGGTNKRRRVGADAAPPPAARATAAPDAVMSPEGRELDDRSATALTAVAGAASTNRRHPKASGTGRRDIQSYFKPNGASVSALAVSGKTHGAQSAGSDRESSDDVIVILEGQTSESRDSGRLAQLSADFEKAKRDKQQLQDMVEALRGEIAKVHDFAARAAEETAQRDSRMKDAMKELLVEAAARDAKDARERVANNSIELGKFGFSRSSGPTAGREMWEDGHSTRKMRARAAALLERKTLLEAKRKAAAKAMKGVEPGSAAELEALQDEEAAKMHLAELKREESMLADARKQLETDKINHARELMRVHSEDRSSLKRVSTLNDRYVLQRLLGKGGFSEVWKAYDLHDLRTVAVKIHQLNTSWSEAKKQSFIKHAAREYQIHKTMRHPRVVALFEIFEISDNSFATVLEHCTGTDLEQHLKANGSLPERDARPVLLQVMCGLQYLNTPRDGLHGGIIHYDLKPANILYDGDGDVKITDFGLSKIMDAGSDGLGTSMELTSQGAGTYWYLPPECFLTGAAAPRISSKVDVWSVGVIYYQMLYGVRPFGEGQSQDSILAERTMLRAKSVDFPVKPAVSEEAKDFIRTCLTHSQVDRPDVLALCKHPYLRPGRGAAPSSK